MQRRAARPLAMMARALAVLPAVAAVSIRLRDPLLPLPAQERDHEAPGYMVTSPRSPPHVSPHACDLGKQADRERCLSVPGRGCMWARVESRNSALDVQESYDYCLPCEIDSQPLPCWTPGAWIGAMQVAACEMSCQHQQRLTQADHACVDNSGTTSIGQCFDRGVRSQSRCMFIAYEDDQATSRSYCRPCRIEGSGTVGCPPSGTSAIAAGWKVAACMSQCDMAGPPAAGPPGPNALRTRIAAGDMVSPLGGSLVPRLDPRKVEAAKEQTALRAKAAAESMAERELEPVVLVRSPADLASFRPSDSDALEWEAPLQPLTPASDAAL